VEACQSRRRGRRLALYARAGVLAVGALMWFAGPAFSAMSRPHPKRPISPAPSRASPPPEGSAAQLSFVSDNVTLTFHTDETATATVPVLNPGQKVDVNFLLVVFPSGQAVPAKAAVAKCSAGLNTVSLVFHKSFPALPTSLTGGAIEVAPDPPASETPPKVELCADRTMINKPLARGALLPHAQAIPVTLRRLTGLSTFFVPLAVGLGSALLFVGLVVWLTRVNRRPRPRGQKLVGAGSAWNAKDNWVTNLAGALGLIGTFFTAASGSSSTLFPGIQLTNFTLLLALWTALIVLAPLVLAFDAAPGRNGVQISLGIWFGIGALTVGAAWAEAATGPRWSTTRSPRGRYEAPSGRSSSCSAQLCSPTLLQALGHSSRPRSPSLRSARKPPRSSSYRVQLSHSQHSRAEQARLWRYERPVLGRAHAKDGLSSNREIRSLS
jgi:hypothetical protein